MFGAIGSTNISQRPFIFTIQTSAPNQTFTIPLQIDRNYKFKVNWGDGSTSWVNSYSDVNKTHTYASANTYTIKIIGWCPAFFVNNTGDKSLIKTVVSWGDIVWRKISFYGCNNLTSLPNESGNFSQITFCVSMFQDCAISVIPNGLFNNNTKTTSFQGTFNGCTSLTSIPSGLFDNNVEATSFQGTFNGCTSLTSIPSGLFDNCPLVTTFQSTFQNTPLVILLPSGLFDNCLLVTTFYRCFAIWSVNTTMTGTSPELWLRTPTPIGTDCFNLRTGLTNYAAIPAGWK